MRFSIGAVGLDSNVARIRSEIRAYQKAQLPLMRKAVALTRRAVVAKVRATYGSKPVRPRKDSKGLPIGPLVRGIRGTVKRTQIDVLGRITYARRAFYGRILEIGTTQRKGHKRGAATVKPHAFRISPRPIMDPVGRAKEPEVIRILGRAYEVFR